MKLAVFSDSHGNVDYLKRAARRAKEKGADLLIHLGDDIEDAQKLEDLEPGLVKVPGVFSEVYEDPSVPNRVVYDFEGVKTLLTHTQEPHENDLEFDLNPAELAGQGVIDLVLYGHTHLPEIKKEEGVIKTNPGHLTTEDKKGEEASFGLVDTSGEQIQVTVLGIEGETKKEETFQ